MINIVRDGGLALFSGGLHQGGEVVDRVEVDVVEVPNFLFDVAGHGQVDHEHRTSATMDQRPSFAPFWIRVVSPAALRMVTSMIVAASTAHALDFVGPSAGFLFSTRKM